MAEKLKENNMKRKAKRFGEGGETIDLRDNKDGPTGIDDDVRARAKKFVETQQKDEEPDTPSSTPKAKPKAKVEPKKDYSDQNDRRTRKSSTALEKERLNVVDKPVERAYPEDYVMPGGILKGIAKSAVRSAEKDTAKKVMKEKAAKGEEEYNRQIRNLAAEKSKKDAAKAAERSERVSSTGASKGDFKPSEMRSDYKKGGKVAGKLATRGYGKAR